MPVNKWKNILINWINCYNENKEKQGKLSLEALHNIISIINERNCLDESTNSIIEAQTIQDFIGEKYPDFKFADDDTALCETDDNKIYLVASLLLFFVCINSKDVHIKKAMCHKLNNKDQKIILNFTKNLMKCSSVKYSDVLAAITDACSLNLEEEQHQNIMKTPPVLRSLHSEVRRLQAALDAERFDRNYLQEELTRTNEKFERLLKEKKQCQTELISLKSKVSSCCGEDKESMVRVSESSAAKEHLTRQVTELEQQLDNICNQLDDVTSERDAYKAQIQELKLDRDKWMSVAQQESTQVETVTGHLENERRTVETLQELIGELQQHNHNNALEASQIECDSLDISRLSLNHNASCNEVCVNVVEVQLFEERTKVTDLKKQVQNLEGKIQLLEEYHRTELENLNTRLIQKDLSLEALHKQIAEEVNKSHTLENNLVVVKDCLTKELHERDKKILETTQRSVEQLEQKDREIQMLQEERQSFCKNIETYSRDIDERNNKIQILVSECNEKEVTIVKIKEDIQRQYLELTENIEGKNEEIIMLQKYLTDKSKLIEIYSRDLENQRNETKNMENKFKQQVASLCEQNHQLEKEICLKTQQYEQLQESLEDKCSVIEQMNQQYNDQLTQNNMLKEKCDTLKRDKLSLTEVNNEAIATTKLLKKQFESAHVKYSQEKLNLESKLNEKESLMDDLNKLVTDEVNIKESLQAEVVELRVELNDITRSINDKNAEILLLKNENENLLQELDYNKSVLCKTNEIFKSAELTYDNFQKDANSKLCHLVTRVDESGKALVEMRIKLNEMIEEKTKEILDLQIEKNNVSQNFMNLEETSVMLKKNIDILKQQIEEDKLFRSKLEKDLENQSRVVKDLRFQLSNEIRVKNDEIVNIQKENDTLLNNIHELRKDFEELQIKYGKERELLQKISNENLRLQEQVTSASHIIDTIRNENNTLGDQLAESKIIRDNLETEKKNQLTIVEDVNLQLQWKINKMEVDVSNLELERDEIMKQKQILHNEIEEKNLQIEGLNTEVNTLHTVVNEYKMKIKILTEKLTDEEHMKQNMNKAHECQINNLNLMVGKLSNYLKEKTDGLELSDKDKENLYQVIDEYKSVNKSLEEEVKSQRIAQERLLNDFETERLILKNMVTVTEQVMEDQKNSLNKTIAEYLKRNEILQEEVKKLEEYLAQEKAHASEIKKDKESMLQLLHNQLNDTKIANLTAQQHYENQLKELKEQICKLNDLLSEKCLDIKSLEAEKCNFLQRIISCEKAKEDLLQSQLEANKIISEMEEKYKNNIQELINVNDELRDEIKNENLRIKSCTEEIETLITKDKCGQGEINILKEQLQQARREIESLVCKGKDEESIISSLKEELDHQRRLSETMISKEKDGQDITNSLKEQLDNKTKKLEDLILKQKEGEKIINSLVEKLEQERKVVRTLINKDKDGQSIISSCKEQLEQENKLVENLTNKERDGQNMIIYLKQQLEEERKLVETLNNKVEDGQSMINSLKDQLEQETKRFETLIHTDKQKQIMINSFKEQLEHEKFVQENLRKEILHLSSAYKDLELKCLKLEELKGNNAVILRIVEENSTKLKKVNSTIKCDTESIQIYEDRIGCGSKWTEASGSKENKSREIEEIRGQLAKLYDDNNLLHKKIRENDIVVGNVIKELQTKVRKNCHTEGVQMMEEGKRFPNYSHKENLVIEPPVGNMISYPNHYIESSDKGSHDAHLQLDSPSPNFMQSSEDQATINSLEKIIQDKNRNITTLQLDITYLKTLIAESENKLLDVTKELDISKENYHQLSNQLKRITQQKNEEIADLRKQLSKMSVTENRASQIIKVSAKYQAVILKRIAEIKTNSALKELTNYGNVPTYEGDIRRSLNAGSITMEELENFLESTEKQFQKCSEKQMKLLKERDRLSELCRINESEAVNMKKCLMELSVHFKTFSSVREMYAQKLSEIISFQRTVRREILSLEGFINDQVMNKLERSYSAAMQDLTETVMNMERWVECCIDRSISPEKMNKALCSDNLMLPSGNFQNASLEIQLNELEVSFQKILEQVTNARNGGEQKNVQAATVMEVRAEYEDKLNRMKSKMKQLYKEQIAIYCEKQREEIVVLEKELQKTREKLEESSQAYKEHIRDLTNELWNVSEKFLMKNNEAEWLRRKQERSGSLMSLQQLCSTGLGPVNEEKHLLDTQSMHSLPAKPKKPDVRVLHMSDEEGEVFDNRWLKELTGPSSPEPMQRLSELKWRNSLCPPHLKSSYPAETQFAPIIDENDIKSIDAVAGPAPSNKQRKEVGITAYKKPGPPTPSKNAGRLSATDSELRESLRSDVGQAQPRKTSTPSRIRALFRSARSDQDNSGTPRSRRLSIFRSKK